MSSLKPVIHGRDHLPGGEDPIPITQLQQQLFSNSHTEWLSVATTSVPGAGGSNSVQVTWSHLSGASLVNLASDPTQPAVTAKGVYTVDVVAAASGGASTHNHFTLELNMVQSAFTAALFAQDVSVDDLAFLSEGCASLTGVMNVGDTFIITIDNWDSASRDFTCPSVRVTRIIELP